MAGDVRSLTVKWLGDASSLVNSTKKAGAAVGDAGKQIGKTGSNIGGTFGKLGAIMGKFHLPFTGAAKNIGSSFGSMESGAVAAGTAVTAGMAVAGAAAIKFGKEAVESAERFNKAHERLAVVVE